MTIKPIILEQPKYVSLTWKEFEEQFKPIKNHFSNDPDEIMFETYGEEVDFVLTKDGEHKVWTYADGDYCSYVSSGYHYVNRIGYYITEVAFDPDTEYEIIVSTEEECECYDEDREDNNGEFGDASCEKCEGYGRVTNYAD
jgi:WD40 repeat protein